MVDMKYRYGYCLDDASFAKLYGTKQENTEGVVCAMQNPYVQIISHPGDGTAELDFERLVHR